MSSQISTHASRHGLPALTLAALGVVYGDIGTSPLYTVKEIFAPHTGVTADAANIIGAVSAVIWALMLVVTLKYVILILRADNRGEGGGLALTALAARAVENNPRTRLVVLLLGLFGATLFYGDSIITPAISVISAVEGIEVITPALQPYIVPLSVMVLLGLFAVQRFGTHSVGRFFGPIMVLWFTVLGTLGIVHIAQQPEILQALNPVHAIRFLIDRGPYVLAAVGAIVLALTGAEALYADMGHFGRKPIQIAWSTLVLPGLALNYMGQGALLMQDPSALANPFYRMFPDELMVGAVVLSTLATIIASQAVISGAYSMTRQAILLGFLPRMEIQFTSAKEAGQIYMPAVNRALLIGVVLAVLAFKSSSALAGAYGIAVSLTMAITTALTFFVIHKSWNMSLPFSILATAFFLVFDLFLFAGCAIKFWDGGWFPVAMGLALFIFMTTWSRGRELLVQSIRSDGLELQAFIDMMEVNDQRLVPRTAVYPVAHPGTVPQAMLHNLKHNHVLHEKNIILTVTFGEIPFVPESERVQVQALGERFWRVTVHYGFMDHPDVPLALQICASQGLVIPEFETSYFLSRETVVSTPGAGMAQWREKLFAAMSRNAGGVVEFFGLPDNAVVELGTRVQI